MILHVPWREKNGTTLTTYQQQTAVLGLQLPIIFVIDYRTTAVYSQQFKHHIRHSSNFICIHFNFNFYSFTADILLCKTNVVEMGVCYKIHFSSH